MIKERDLEKALGKLSDLKLEMAKNLKRQFFNVLDSVDEGIGEKGMELEFDIFPEDMEVNIRDTLFVSYVREQVKCAYNDIIDYETMEDIWWFCGENGVDDVRKVSSRTLATVKKALGL